MKNLSKEELDEIIKYLNEKTGGKAICLILADRSLLLRDVPIGMPFMAETKIIFAGIDINLQQQFLFMAAETQKLKMQGLLKPIDPPQADGSIPSPFFNNLGPI